MTPDGKREKLEATEIAPGGFNVAGRLYFADEFAKECENFKTVIVKKCPESESKSGQR